MDLVLLILTKFVLAAIPALGFAMVFKVPRKALLYCTVLGGVAYSFKTVLQLFSMHIILAVFFAAILVGLLGIILSHRLLIPPKVFTVAAIIPMFPGVAAYTAMIALVNITVNGFNQQMFEIFINNFCLSCAIVAALSIGITLPGVWIYRNKLRI